MFRAKIKADVLKEVLPLVRTLVDEVNIGLDSKGMLFRAIDPSHIAMIELRLSKEAFEEYKAKSGVMGLNLIKLMDFLKLARAGEIISMELDDEKNLLLLKVGQLTRKMALVNPGSLSETKMPKLDPPGQVVVNVDHLKQGIRASEGVSVQVALRATPEAFHMESEGDQDSVDLELPKDHLEKLDVKDTLRSLYPLDYFSNLVRAIPSGTIVTLNVGNDYPMKVEFEVCGGNGYATYLVAPRIEN